MYVNTNVYQTFGFYYNQDCRLNSRQKYFHIGLNLICIVDFDIGIATVNICIAKIFSP
jgi:hypothetical protein